MDFTQISHPVWQVLSSGWFTGAYCLAVFVFGGRCYVKFSKRRKQISAALDDAIKKLKKLSGFADRKGYGALFDDYDRVSDDWKKDPILQAAWGGFSRQVHRPEEYGLVSANLGCWRFSLKDPREFFHEESLWLNQFNERWFASIPNLLTGLGILGTFLGLVAGLSLADFSTDAENLSTNTVAEASSP